MKNMFKPLLYLITLGVLVFFLSACKSNSTSKAFEVNKKIEQMTEDIVFGEDTVQNAIFIYASYNCKYCRYLFSRTFPDLKKNYLDKGVLKVVMKLVEFREDTTVLNSLKIASCIYRFGQYQKMHELLLANPDVVRDEEFNLLIDDVFDRNNKIAECFFINSKYDFIKKNVNEFRALGFKGTPTIVIKDKAYSGFVSYEKLKSILKQEFKI